MSEACLDQSTINRLIEARILFHAPKYQECSNDFHKVHVSAQWIFRSNWRSEPFKGYASCQECLKYGARRITRFDPLPSFPAKGCLLQQKCWKCDESGLLFAIGFLERWNGSSFCVDGESIMREPFISLLRNYFTEHPEQRSQFGKVKSRWIKWKKRKAISQGCPHCDISWQIPKLNSSYVREYDDMLLGIPHHITGKAIFSCDAKDVLPPVHPWFNRIFSRFD